MDAKFVMMIISLTRIKNVFQQNLSQSQEKNQAYQVLFKHNFSFNISGGAIAGITCGVLVATAIFSIGVIQVIKRNNKLPSRKYIFFHWLQSKNSARYTEKTPQNLQTSSILETKIIPNSPTPTEEKPLMP